MENQRPIVPPGYRFDPTDEELIGKFLHRRVVEQLPLPYPHNLAIHDYNMFGTKLEPSQIWAAYGGGDLVGDCLYFFSEIKKVTPKGSNVVRKMGSGKGSWNGKSISVMVFKGDGSIPIGQKRTFPYKNKGMPDDGRWLLDEYSLFSGPRNNGQGNNNTGYDFDVVLCRLRKKDGSVIKNEKNNNKRKSPCPASSSSSCSHDFQINPIKKMRPPKKVSSFEDLMKSEPTDDEEEEAVVVPELSCPSVDDHVLDSEAKELVDLLMSGNYDSQFCLDADDLLALGISDEEEAVVPVTPSDASPPADAVEEQAIVVEEEDTLSLDLVEDLMNTTTGKEPETQEDEEVLPLSEQVQEEILSYTAVDGAVEEEETCNPSFIEYVSAQTAVEVEEEARWDPSVFNDFMAEIQQDHLPIAYGNSGDGGLEEIRNDQNIFEKIFNESPIDSCNNWFCV